MLADEQSQSCTQLPNGSYTKDLALVEADLSCVCLIDNSPVSYKVNEGVFPFLLAVPHSAFHTIPSLSPSGNVSALSHRAFHIDADNFHLPQYPSCATVGSSSPITLLQRSTLVSNQQPSLTFVRQ